MKPSLPHSAFRIPHSQGSARLGVISTNHGEIETPAFMPVGTCGSVKAIDTSDLRAAGATVMLSNTYHLLLRPGPDLVRKMGGLHRFTGTTLPILTDSGGFQVMSLSKLRTITDEGVRFASHLDGSEIFLSPEEAARVQNALGSDIQMQLDVCPPAGAGEEEVVRALELSAKWAERTIAHEKPEGVLRFGIAQGGMSAALRERSAGLIRDMPFDGFAVGGLSVGEPEPVMMEMLDAQAHLLPAEKPRYLMGVGVPSQILAAVRKGIDLFDCVLPTRIARHGTLWTSRGTLRINRLENADDAAPPDSDCPCLLCRGHSRAYLRHLYRVDDPLYARLASLHNLTWILGFMKRIREAIREGRPLEDLAPAVEGI